MRTHTLRGIPPPGPNVPGEYYVALVKPDGMITEFGGKHSEMAQTIFALLAGKDVTPSKFVVEENPGD